MSSNRFAGARLCVFASFLALGFTATASFGQTAALSTPRVSGPVNESQLTILQGNTLPQAKARFDRGAVADNAPAGHMLMVLKRSEAQQKALDAVVASQKDPKSPNYHKWLTAEQFGERFGVADADLQAVTSYLAAQGFVVGRVFKDKMAVEFSGTAGQVRSAFRTEIHSYSVNGQRFNANVSAPQIPAALHPVVKGVTLNNYKPPVPQATQRMLLDRKTGRSRPLYADLFNQVQAVAPGDLAVIYDIPSTATGSGVTVGVIGDSNINLQIPANYRTVFDLPANAPTVIVDGSDPGVNADADLAYGTIELLAATAPQAKVNFYTAATTDLDTGLDFAAIRAVEDNTVQVLVFGFESCEANLGAGVNQLYDVLWQQAAAEGVSVITSAGTGGAAECDAGANGATAPATATHGLGVNGYASTPFDTAVGASDFFYGPTGTVNLNDPNNVFFTFWSLTNGGTAGFTSAKKYIPEQPFNSSFQATNQQSVTSVVQASGGGASTVGQTGADGVTQSPYAQPSYQAGVAGGISDFRVIPDVSFFGGNINNFSTYILCIDGADCVDGSPDSLEYTGGKNSMLAASAFAGIAALVVQAHGPQGNLNDGLYATAAATPGAFHDIANGTNKVACTAGSPDCAGGFTATAPPTPAGPAYNAVAGYDAASGLGSVDVANLISGWKTTTGAGPATIAVTLTENGSPVTTFQHGAPVQLNVSVTGGAGTPTGDISVTTSATGHPRATVIAQTLDSTGQVIYPAIGGLLPGGSYPVTVRYTGDANYGATVTSIPVTITPVTAKLTMLTTDQFGNPLPIYNGQTVPYGSSVQFTLAVADAINSSDPASATGFVTVSDNGKQITELPLNSEGFASFSSSSLAAGSHVFSATYNGDSTFSTTSLTGAAPSVAIGGVQTATTVISTDPNPSTTNNVLVLVATVTPVQVCAPLVPCPTGAAPAGKVRFKDGNKNLGTVALNLGMNTGSAPSSSATLTLIRNTLAAGANLITATYIPDNTGNYLASSSASFTVTVGTGAGLANTTTGLSTTPGNATNFLDTSNLTFVASVSSALRRGTLGGSVTFFSNGTAIGSPVTLDAAGIAAVAIPQDSNGLLELPLGQSNILAQYSGDAAHGPSSAAYTINVYDKTSTPDFAMQSNVTFQTIAKGNKTAKFTLQFTSMNNLAALGIPITLTSTGPASITCSGAPASPNFKKTIYATVTYTCKPAAGVKIGQLATPPLPGAHSQGWWMAEGGATLACIFLFGMPGRRRKWQSLMGSLALFVVAFGVTGCGASVNGGPAQNYYDSLLDSGSSAAASTVLAPGTYTVIVTGTASVFANGQASTTVNVVHNLPLQIIVQ